MTQHSPDSSAGPTITVHPHGELTTYFGRSYGGIPVSIEPGITIDGLLERLGVPANEVWLVAENGETVKRAARPQPGDSLEIFPPAPRGSATPASASAAQRLRLVAPRRKPRGRR